MRQLLWVDELDTASGSDVRALLTAAAATDGWPTVTADGPLPPELSGGHHLLAIDDAGLVGYGHLDTAGDAFGRQVAELIVHPGHRGHGHGRRLADALVAASTTTLRAWSHAAHPAADALARSLEFRAVRQLLRMAATTPADAYPMPALPAGVRLRSFVPGTDERAVTDVNARAFSWHPEQGAMTVDDLLASQREDWFDAAGFIIAEDAAGAILGFHWTKVHPPTDDADTTGEVYVVGVDPAAQGSGLGTALTVAGLEHLRQRGLRRVILYVEGDNPAAITVYSRLGFGTDVTAIQYERPAAPA